MSSIMRGGAYRVANGAIDLEIPEHPFDAVALRVETLAVVNEAAVLESLGVPSPGWRLPARDT
jgi:hypothetical protein